jgi:general L-amino acid transport system substrate-binding protein
MFVVVTRAISRAAVLVLGLAAAQPAAAQTLQAIKDRGALLCGVNEGLYGFAAPDSSGAWRGFDVDFCRAIAAAIFDDASKVRFVPLSAADRFARLQAGVVDVLSRNSTWTLAREAELKLHFAAVTYYDGQGLMVRNALNVMSGLELDGRRICVQQDTTNALNLSDFFRANRMRHEVVAVASADEGARAYDSGRCDVLTSDISQLHALRLLLSRPNDHVVLPDIISKEPLGPVVRQGDDQWLGVVRWTHFAMLNAEELGVGAATLTQALQSKKPEVMRLVGTDGEHGEQLGLTRDWVVRIIRQVGNYGEVFERNLGIDSKLGIPRGINQLWGSGGIQYAPPIR